MEQTKKSNKLKIIIPVVIAVIAIAAIVAGVILSNNGSKETEAQNNTNTVGANGTKKEMTKEEMIAQATKLDVLAYSKELAENNAAADKKYEDKIVEITGQVSKITSFLSECTIVFPDTQLMIHAELTEDDLLKIKTGDTITVVGKGLRAGGFTTVSDIEGTAYLVSIDK